MVNSLKIHTDTSKKPMVRFEQKYRMHDLNGTKAIQESFCRELAQAHYLSCLYAGIKMKSFANLNDTNLSDWAYEIEEPSGDLVEVCDSVWMARFILHRLGEDFNTTVKFESESNSMLYIESNEDILSKIATLGTNDHLECVNQKELLQFRIKNTNFDPYFLASFFIVN